MSNIITDMTEYLTDGGYSENEISEFRGLLTGERITWPIWNKKLFKLLIREGYVNMPMARANGAWPNRRPGDKNYNKKIKSAWKRFRDSHDLTQSSRGWEFRTSKAIHLFDKVLANTEGNEIDLSNAHSEIRKNWVKEIKEYANKLGWKRNRADTNKWLLRRTP